MNMKLLGTMGLRYTPAECNTTHMRACMKYDTHVRKAGKDLTDLNAYQRHCIAVNEMSPTISATRCRTTLLKAKLDGPTDSRQSVDKLPLEMLAKAKLVVLKTQRRLLGVGILI